VVPLGPHCSEVFATGPMGSVFHRNLSMKLITDSLTATLLANGRAQRAAMDQGEDALDFKPVVKLFSILPSGRAVRAPALARHRRVRRASPTRLPNS
jgi:hypothetical protein